MSENNYCVIGKSLPHTASPFIHNHLMRLRGISGQYSVKEFPDGLFRQDITELSRLAGFNVTIPFKTEIIPFLEQVDKSAQLYNSVNTIKSTGGKMYGYNTDCLGFLGVLELIDCRLEGRVLVLGNGGVARTAAFESVRAGAQLTIAGRSESKCLKLRSEVLAKFPKASVKTACLSEISGEYDLLVNCTPVGMYPNVGECPVNESVIEKCACVYDMIYNPKETELIRKAARMGKKCSSGMSMLVIQAAQAQKIWNNVDFSQEELLDLVEKTNRFLEDNF